MNLISESSAGAIPPAPRSAAPTDPPATCGEEKIIKMIEKETAKLRKRDDGMVKVADLADNLIAEIRSKENG